MKRKLLCAMLAALLIACQPTPEADAIRQKDTYQLIESVRENESPADKSTSVRDLFPDRFQANYTLAAQAVTVQIDAPIRVLSDSGFPVLRVERRTLTDAERLALLKHAFGAETLYRFVEQPDRETLAQWIRDYMQEPTPEEKARWLAEDPENTEETWQDFLEERRQISESLQEQYRTLSDEAELPAILWNGELPDPLEDAWVVSDPNVHLIRGGTPFARCAKDGEAVHYIGIWGGLSNYALSLPCVSPISEDQYDNPPDGAVITPRRAAEIAESCFAGIDAMSALDVRWGSDLQTDGEQTGVSRHQYYLVRMTPSVFDAQLLYEPFGSDTKSDEAVAASAYQKEWNYESAEVMVSGDGAILQLDWRAPHTVSEQISALEVFRPYHLPGLSEPERSGGPGADQRARRIDHRSELWILKRIQNEENPALRRGKLLDLQLALIEFDDLFD